MDNGKDIFEQHINDAVEQYIVDFNPAHWDEMNTMLNANNKKDYHIEKWAAAAVVVSFIAATVFWFSSNEKTPCKIIAHKTDQKLQIEKVQENTPKTDEIKTESIKNNQKEDVIVISIEQTDDEDNIVTPQHNIDQPKENNENSAPESEIASYKKEKDNNQNKQNDAELSIYTSKNNFCVNEGIEFSNNTELNTTWTFGDGQSAKGKKVNHQYAQAGNYTVSLTTENGNTITKNITINPNPEVYIDIERPSNNDIDQLYHFTATDYGTSKIEWMINNGTYTKKEVKVSFYKNGLHDIKLTGENNFGCKTTVSEKLQIERDYDLMAPTSFSPDNDGINDYWMPRALAENNVIFELTIYDRSGKLVFKTNNPNQQWDGTYPDGTKANSLETYIWTAVYFNNNNERCVSKGGITVVK